MPVDDDYGRRQITSQSPVPPSHHQCSLDHRYASDKSLLDSHHSCIASSASDHHQHHRYNDRFCSERSNSDRLPSGERYQGVSERYPLGERPQTSVSSDRLLSASKDINNDINDGSTATPIAAFAERYNSNSNVVGGGGHYQRYPERYTPVGSLDRYHGHHHHQMAYSRTSTPTTYHTLSDTAKHHQRTNKQCSNNSSTNTNRNNYDFGERFPPIPCPERFATQVPYMEPPSPAPASDRFVPPPPLSPSDQTPSPDCFPNNAFPSPTAPPPPQERFIPPPPLSPSPTEKYSPKKAQRQSSAAAYQQQQQQYERYAQEQRAYKNQFYAVSSSVVGGAGGGDGRSSSNSTSGSERAYHLTGERYVNSDRYIPPNAHMPVERYVPQQQESYYYQNNYDRFNKYTNSSQDPYMRRDLAYHYRLPLPYPSSSNQYQRVRYVGTPNRVKCCQYQSSPGSSSSSSITSQKDIGQCAPPPASLQEMQCQSYLQEKGTQCGKECNNTMGFVSPNLRKSNNAVQSQQQQQCRHSICASPSVEYVGASGGRHVCATPPPRGSIGSEGSICNESCCNGGTQRRNGHQNALTVAVWRATPPQPSPSQQQPQQLPSTPKQPTPPLQSTSQQRVKTPIPLPTTSTEDPTCDTPKSKATDSPPELRHHHQPPPQQHSSPHPVQRAVSLPVSSPPPHEQRAQQATRLQYSQSERIPNRSGNVNRSKKDIIKNYLKRETATFFGIDEENEEKQQRRWLDRRIRMAARAYGSVKDEYRNYGGRRPISELPSGSSRLSGQLQAERPDVLPGPSDITDSVVGAGVSGQNFREVTLRRKDSVARMTLDGLSYVVNTITRHRPRRWSQQSQLSRSFPPDTQSLSSSSALEEEAFFQKPSSPTSSPRLALEGDSIDRGGVVRTSDLTTTTTNTAGSNRLQRLSSSNRPSSTSGWKRDNSVVLRHAEGDQTRPIVGDSKVDPSLLDNVHDNSDRRQYGMGWVGRMFGRSMRKSMLEDMMVQQQLDDMEDHRPMFTYWVTTVQILVLVISLFCYGFGPFGVDMQSQSGQVLVTSLSLQQVDFMEPANFWGGPRAADLIHLGAKFAPCMRIDDKISQQIDKIRAKERETACCIRNDDSGCVQSSQADCSVRGLRPTKTISTWKKWSAGDSGPGGRISGSVCGLDPKYCDAPASVHPYEWPDDITKWPICRKTNPQFSTQKRSRDKIAEHMVCEVIGHPCCIGLHGQCKITTREYCDFVRGTFHEEASLCSQVSCLNDVCGMLPFYYPESPDQFYRLWTSLFLHAGVLQLTITVLIQFFLMRDLEKLTGSLRISIIYIGSGVAGNLASAIFVPYRADVGPSGSQFGLLACSIVEVLNAWPMLKNPNRALGKLLVIVFGLFLLGLLPWVDNYAHLFGFVFGFLLSYALLPFISFGMYERQKKIALIWVCLLSAAFLFICLVLLFYIIPVYDCKICSYFNCIPFTRDFCASQNINFKREEPIV